LFYRSGIKHLNYSNIEEEHRYYTHGSEDGKTRGYWVTVKEGKHMPGIQSLPLYGSAFEETENPYFDCRFTVFVPHNVTSVFIDLK